MAARSGIVGLGSRLYPGNMQRIFNKDLTRFMQSLFRERQNRASKRKALLAGCPTGNISAYLDHGVLVSFVKTLPFYVKDTNHALHIFDSFRFDTTDPGHRLVLFTMDVKSLYTVIPNNCGLQALTYLLDKREIKEPSTSTLRRLAELVLSLNSFSFNNEYYCQISVVAMGSKMGPNYALVMWNNRSENST